MSRKAPVITICPACDTKIRFRKSPYVGQYKICAECDTELQVTNTSPIELDYLEDEYQDDEDEFDYFIDEDDLYTKKAIQPKVD